jgi:hypothetical protein
MYIGMLCIHHEQQHAIMFHVGSQPVHNLDEIVQWIPSYDLNITWYKTLFICLRNLIGGPFDQHPHAIILKHTTMGDHVVIHHTTYFIYDIWIRAAGATTRYNSTFKSQLRWQSHISWESTCHVSPSIGFCIAQPSLCIVKVKNRLARAQTHWATPSHFFDAPLNSIICFLSNGWIESSKPNFSV